MPLQSNPFGQTILTDDILDTLGFFDAWEDRYKYIIDLGKELPAMAAANQIDENIVRGCQSQVWILSDFDGSKLWFEVDSDAFIVKGLLGVVLAAYNGKSPREILDFDIESYFDQLELMQHLSSTRGNGLRAMVQKIQQTAQLAS